MIRHIFFFFLFWLILLFYPKTTLANTSCAMSIDNKYLVPNSQTSTTITLTNNGDTSINWIRVPQNYSSVLFIDSQTISRAGWNQENNSDHFLYTGTTVNQGDSISFTTTFTAADERDMTIGWLVSDDSGSNLTSCSDLNLSVTNSPPTPPNISNISLSISNQQTTITWSNNQEAVGTIRYGTSEDLSSSQTTSSNTAHSVTLSNLSPSTKYYYQISSSNSNGTTTTDRYNFTTTDTSVTTSTVVTNVITTVQNTITKFLSDNTPPSIVIKTNLDSIFKTSPRIEGIAKDTGYTNPGILSVEYSIDNGKNWIPADTDKGVGGKNILFNFIPPFVDDGDYKILIRATDLSKNTSQPTRINLTIDRLPPIIGGALYLFGPQIISSNNFGETKAIKGLPMKLFFSAIGGPTKIDMHLNDQILPAEKSFDNLWTITITPEQSGSLSITADAIDGGKNTTQKQLRNLTVLEPGQITSNTNQPIENAQVTVYVFDKNTDHYVMWDAKPYLQQNPQNTNSDGQYRLYLPPGKYYLEITRNKFAKTRSNIFEIFSSSPIVQKFTLQKPLFHNLFFANSVKISTDINYSKQVDSSPLVGKDLPSFDLSTPEYKFDNFSVLGKPSIITLISSWTPQTNDQLNILENIKKGNPGINVFAITVEESVPKTLVLQKVGNYQTPIIADPDGTFVSSFYLQSLPVHIFTDKSGIIKSVSNGFLNELDLINEVLN